MSNSDVYISTRPYHKVHDSMTASVSAYKARLCAHTSIQWLARLPAMRETTSRLSSFAAAAIAGDTVELSEFAFVTATHDPKGPVIALLRHLMMQASPFGPPVHCTPL